jgi:hypothetical protein
MEDKQLTNCFTAIKKDFNRLDEKLDKQDELLNQIALTTATTLEIIKSNDIRVKEMEARLKEHERRLYQLERTHA